MLLLYICAISAMKMSVPEAVREIVTRNRSIHDCIRMDIVNYTALAVKIQPEVEKMLGSSTNLNTVVVAIKRYADSFERVENVERDSLLKNARLSLVDGVMDIRMSVDDLGSEAVASLLDKFARSSRDYDLFRMAGTVRVLTEDVEGVRRIFGSLLQEVSPFDTGLVKIKVFVPEGRGRSDVISYAAEILHYGGIELINAFFDRDNIVLILKERDASRAYEILRSNASL